MACRRSAVRSRLAPPTFARERASARQVPEQNLTAPPRRLSSMLEFSTSHRPPASVQHRDDVSPAKHGRRRHILTPYLFAAAIVVLMLRGRGTEGVCGEYMRAALVAGSGRRRLLIATRLGPPGRSAAATAAAPAQPVSRTRTSPIRRRRRQRRSRIARAPSSPPPNQSRSRHRRPARAVANAAADAGGRRAAERRPASKPTQPGPRQPMRRRPRPLPRPPAAGGKSRRRARGRPRGRLQRRLLQGFQPSAARYDFRNQKRHLHRCRRQRRHQGSGLGAVRQRSEAAARSLVGQSPPPAARPISSSSTANRPGPRPAACSSA